MRMMIDAYAPEGITELAVDSIFMMPHLGVLSTVNEDAATQVFEKDCIIYLGTCIAPIGAFDADKPLLKVVLEQEGQKRIEQNIDAHRLELLPLEADVIAQATITPLQPELDLGEGPGKGWTGSIRGGVVGLVIDTRGRGIQLPSDGSERTRLLQDWCRTLDEYPVEGEE